MACRNEALADNSFKLKLISLIMEPNNKYKDKQWNPSPLDMVVGDVSSRAQNPSPSKMPNRKVIEQ